MNKLNSADGFFIMPYTQHDLGVITLGVFGFFFVMYLEYKSPHTDNPTIKDWGGTAVFSAMFSIIFYEYAIYKNMVFGIFLSIFGLGMLLSKPIIEFLFMTKEGKNFVINVFKKIIIDILGKLGFTKNDK